MLEKILNHPEQKEKQALQYKVQDMTILWVGIGSYLSLYVCISKI